MLCASHEENLNLFLDGQLPVEAQIELFKHLAGCDGCRDFLEKTNRFRAAARREKIPFPENLDRALFEEILRRRHAHARETPTRRIFPGWRQPVAVPKFAVAAVVIILLVLSGLEINDRLTPPPAIPVYQMMMPNANPVGVIYIIAQPMPVESFKSVMPDTTLKKGTPHEPPNPSIAAFISLWSAVLEHDGFCAG